MGRSAQRQALILRIQKDQKRHRVIWIGTRLHQPQSGESLLWEQSRHERGSGRDLTAVRTLKDNQAISNSSLSPLRCVWITNPANIEDALEGARDSLSGMAAEWERARAFCRRRAAEHKARKAAASSV